LTFFSTMDKYRADQISELKNKYLTDLPRVRKLKDFYYRTEIQSPNCSVLLDQSSYTPALTLQCPITKTRQTVPVRTLHCKHVETFDMFNFLDSFSFNDILLKGFMKSLLPASQAAPPSVLHNCPICRAKGPLYIDTLVSSALTLFFPEVLTVHITPAGLLVSPPKIHVLNHSIVDLVSPPYKNSSTILPPPELTCSPLHTPDPFCLTGTSCESLKRGVSNGFARRTFSFGDSCMSLGRELGVGKERYTRLSTIDLSSPC